MISTSTSRAGIALGAVTAALFLVAPTASAAAQDAGLAQVNGHTDKWMAQATPSVTYDNGYKVDSAEEVKSALEQCKDSGVSCAEKPVESKQVTKWFDVGNDAMGVGPIENCGTGQGEINQTLSGSKTFTWGWNVGGNVDLTLVKDVLKIGASAQYSETNAETKAGDIRITVKPGERGMLMMGKDTEQRTSDVTIQGGKFGGAKITGLRTEILLAEAARVSTDVVKCGELLKKEQS
ncbi:hypothetical protein [Streptomyces decoyicus]|uniref:hypothetical protein n=1 Tax=Streptomyces decoyicus TaxID=249567 RepID=UPI00386326E6